LFIWVVTSREANMGRETDQETKQEARQETRTSELEERPQRPFDVLPDELDAIYRDEQVAKSYQCGQKSPLARKSCRGPDLPTRKLRRCPRFRDLRYQDRIHTTTNTTAFTEPLDHVSGIMESSEDDEGGDQGGDEDGLGLALARSVSIEVVRASVVVIGKARIPVSNDGDISREGNVND